MKPFGDVLFYFQTSISIEMPSQLDELTSISVFFFTSIFFLAFVCFYLFFFFSFLFALPLFKWKSLFVWKIVPSLCKWFCHESLGTEPKQNKKSRSQIRKKRYVYIDQLLSRKENNHFTLYFLAFCFNMWNGCRF